MDDGFQQKKNRLDSLSSRLARGQAQARTATREEPRKCKGCASDLAPGTTGDSCGTCATPSSSGAPSNRRCCPECGLGVLTVSNFLTCSVCRKWIHADCDRSIEADPDDYTCARCRQSPIVGNDAMLGVAVDSPLADAEASNQGASNLGSLMGSMRSSPVAGSIGGESVSRYSQRERRLSGSSESSSYSARNSPSFDPNACSEDDDFIPGVNRGGGSSRGGRGGKKKPGGRGGTLMKTRSGGKPPSGVFLDRLGKTERGKRGKGGGRGAGKAGSTAGKGRGGAAAAARRTSTSSGRVGSVVGNGATAAMNQLFLAAANANPVLAAVLQQTMAAQAQAAAKGKPQRAAAAEDAPTSSSASAAVDSSRGGEKEDEYVRTVVIVPEDDAFISCSPLCLVCGSVGRSTEQSMVACSGCAHSFHTYCVGLHEKMNTTVRDRGWRCLDCTMCEGCGKSTDESKLIMCEECDVAYHMYCLNPPLERAPSGQWRCQWCAKCRRCQVRVASSGELTKEGLCYPCLSLRKCPKCNKLYQINENIIRCSQCIKWYHGTCEELHTEEMLESAAINKMRCSSCRPNANRGFSSLNDGNITICDNVALNKCADEVLKSKMMPQLFRANSFTDSSGGSSALAGLLGDFRSGGSMDSHYGGSMDDDNGPDDDGPGGLSGLITFGPGSRGGRGGGRGGGAGRGRMLKLGVGGFFVKLPKHKQQAAAEKDENAAVDPNDPTKKVKVTRKPRRSQLEDFYPSQIQEGFFGTRPVDGKALADVEVAEPTLEEYKIPKTIKNPFAMGNTLSQSASDSLRTDIEESNMLENMNLNEMMNFDEGALDFDTFFDDDDDLALTDALDFMKDDTESSQPKPEPEDGSSQQAPHQQAMHHPHGMGMQPGMGPGGLMIKQEPGLMHQHQMMQQHAHMMGAGGMMIKQEPGMMRPESSMSGGSMMAAPVGSAQGERVSASQAATERWEEDEPLGDKATKAAVLYVNIIYPDLRTTMPQWSERAKFIHKTWRSLSSDDRQIYVQKARHNRAQREKIPRPRGPRQPQIGAPGTSAAAHTVGQVAMRMTAGGAVAPTTFAMQGAMGAVRAPMPGMPQQPPSLDHLPPNLQQEYREMCKAASEFTQKQEELDKTLAGIRTTKKKLGAKLRQIQKVETAKALAAATAAAAAAGQPPPTEVPPVGDLNPIDRESLETAHAQTPNATKACEDAKRDTKTHMTAMRQFEMNHNILTEYVLAHRQTTSASASNSGPTVGGMLSATMGGRQGMAMGMAGPHGYQQMMVQQQVPFSQIMGQERTFQLGGIGGSGAMMGSRMGPMGRWPPTLLRSPALGGMRYDQLQSAEDREVYECIDEMIGKISYDLDGPPPMMQQPQQMGAVFPGGGPSLKRMLDPMAPPLIGMNPMMQVDDGAPKQKKKRQIQKKATNTSSEQTYDACWERMRSALSACPPLTRKSIEPVARNEASPFPWPGMSELERFQEANASLGNLTLSFAVDAYKNIRHAPHPPEVSMARITPNVRMSLLHQMAHPSCASPSTPWMVRDEGDTSSPSTSQGVATVSNAPGAASDVIRHLVSGVERRRGVLRCLAKSNEGTFPPTDPHRIAFKEIKKEEDEEVEIAIEIEERCAPGPSGVGGEMLSSNSTSSQTTREEMTKALLHKLQLMLQTKKPIEDYQMDTPPQSPTAVAEPQMELKPTPLGMPLSPRCRLCRMEISAATATGVRQNMSQLGLTPSDDGNDDTVTFCTHKCYYIFVGNAKVALSPEELAAAEAHVDDVTYNRLKQISADSFARCINQSSMARIKPELSVGSVLAAQMAAGPGGLRTPTSAGPPPPTPIGAGGGGGGGGGGTPLPDVTSPRENRFAALMDEPAPRKENIVVIRCAELAKLEDPGRKERSRAAGEDWKKYDQVTINTFLKIHDQKKELAKAPKMGIEFVNPILDTRKCVLCYQKGDLEPHQGGRLLNYDACGWVHANCVVWSNEVFECPNGSLVNVDKAIIRGSQTRCVLCNGVGATLQCYKMECQKNFHFACATRCFGRFLKDKIFFCPTHTDVHNEALATLDPLRKLYIPRDENKLLAKLFENLDAPRLMLRLGAFTFLRLGQLLPEQLKSCHSDRFIFPLGYSAQRMYWSPMDAKKRVKFSLKIEDHEGRPMFCVSMPPLSNDLVGAAAQGQQAPAAQPMVWRKSTAGEAWKEIVERVNSVRLRSGAFLRSSATTMEPECLFGLGEGVITKMTESLPGVDTLYSYAFRHGGAPILELPLAENPSGCARCEPRLRTLIKSHRRPAPSGAKASSSGGGGGKRTQSLYEELQMCMKASGYKDFAGIGTNGKWDQYGSTEQSFSAYQKMRKEWRNTVYLARSKIQGLGLYAKRDIDMGAMIIEYKGEIVRGEVCEMREKRYFAQNRGTYMFKASDECIIDATMKGGPARYINHSCDPNCATHIMHLGANGEDKKIIITANRPIKADEELTYDYQFDIEDDSEKVACLCGAPNCQRWMN